MTDGVFLSLLTRYLATANPNLATAVCPTETCANDNK